MKRDVNWSQDALDDFKQLIDYIAARNSDAAQRIADKILQNCDMLADISTGRRGRVDNTYEKNITQTPYIIAYTITETGNSKAVSILRVIHSARDWREDKWPD